MRDEMDGRIWTAHHENFSRSIDNGLAAVGARLARVSSWDGTTQHLLALVASLALTALTFNGTTA